MLLATKVKVRRNFLKRRLCFFCDVQSPLFLWAQLDLNQRPPDYESGATNRLSYGPNIPLKNVSLQKQLQK